MRRASAGKLSGIWEVPCGRHYYATQARERALPHAARDAWPLGWACKCVSSRELGNITRWLFGVLWWQHHGLLAAADASACCSFGEISYALLPFCAQACASAQAWGLFGHCKLLNLRLNDKMNYQHCFTFMRLPSATACSSFRPLAAPGALQSSPPPPVLPAHPLPSGCSHARHRPASSHAVLHLKIGTENPLPWLIHRHSCQAVCEEIRSRTWMRRCAAALLDRHLTPSSPDESTDVQLVGCV